MRARSTSWALTIHLDVSRDLDERRLAISSVDHFDLRAGHPPLRHAHCNGKGGALYPEEVL